MALLWIAMLALVLAVVQVAMIFYSGQLALAAAEDGVRSGRYYGAPSTESARRDAEAFLNRAAGSTLAGAVVTATLDGATLRVTVAGDAPSVVPGVRMRVSREAVGGLERITP